MPVTIHPDYRILVVFALFNSVYGHDEELGERKSDSRITLLNHCERCLADVPVSRVENWRAYRADHPLHIWAHLYYALTCSRDDLSANAVSRTDIPSDLRETVDELTGFDRVMRDFAQAVRIRELFADLSSDWEQAVAAYDANRIQADIERVHRFLKLSDSEIPRVDINILPAPFESHFVAYAAPFEHAFYTIDGPGTARGGFNIHEYLHLFVNRIEIEEVPGKVLEAIKDVAGSPAIANDYNDPKSFLYENTVRATHYAIGGGDPREIPYAIESDRSIGLTLVGELYEQIRRFPDSDEPSFSRYINGVWDMLR